MSQKTVIRSISFRDDIDANIEKARGLISRSGYLNRVLEEHFNVLGLMKLEVAAK